MLPNSPPKGARVTSKYDVQHENAEIPCGIPSLCCKATRDPSKTREKRKSEIKSPRFVMA
jgi:hypothetical protein